MNPYIKLPKVPIVVDRHDFVLEHCKGKRVLHLGCVDSGLLPERFFSGVLLHQELAKVADNLWGIDIDADGISFLRRHNFDNLIVGDVCKLDKIPELQDQYFDVIVASELIEHLMNPGLFLEAVKKLMIPGHTELIVTVPNAFRVSTLLQLLHGVEYIHPDHNYWFSYHTITNLLIKSGFEIKEVCVYSFSYPQILPSRLSRLFGKETKCDPSSTSEMKFPQSSIWTQGIRYFRSIPSRLFIRFLYKKTPFFGDGIAVVAKITKPTLNGKE